MAVGGDVGKRVGEDVGRFVGEDVGKRVGGDVGEAVVVEGIEGGVTDDDVDGDRGSNVGGKVA